MRDILKEFRDFRREADLPYNPDFVPRSFDSMVELDHGYHQNEIRAEAAEAKAQQQLAMVRKSAECDDYVTADAVDFAFGAMATQLKSEALDPIYARLAKLEAESLRWAGTWRAGNTYRQNDLVQDKGLAWVAVAPDASARPGEGSGWRMLQKSEAAK
jgi:hypothetical protein